MSSRNYDDVTHGWLQRETDATDLKLQIFTLNENKTDIPVQSKATYTYVQSSTTMLTQKNKHNIQHYCKSSQCFTEKTSLQLWDSWPERNEGLSTNAKFQWRAPLDSCCHHNSSITAAAIATATPISQVKRPRHGSAALKFCFFCRDEIR